MILSLFSKENKQVFFLEVLALMGLLISYPEIGNLFHYMGFENSFSFPRLIFVIGFFFIFSLIGVNLVNRFIWISWHILFILMFLGPSVYYCYNPSSPLTPLYSSIIFLLIFPISDILRLQFDSPGIKITDDSSFMFFVVIGMLLVASFLIYLPYINIKNILLIDVYKTRLLFREISKPFQNYLYGPLTRVILPIIIVIAAKKRLWFIVALGTTGLIYLYLCGALKSTFVGVFAVLIFLQGNYHKKLKRFLWILLGITFGGLIYYNLSGDMIILNNFVRRVFFTPGLLDKHYYEYFTDNYIWWSHNPLGALFFEYPLSDSPSKFIGEVIMGNEGNNANIGVVTESFFSGGFLGVILQSTVICIMFAFLKGIELSKDYFGIIFLFLYYLNTSFIATLLLTHGLLFFLLFAQFVLKKR